MQKQSFLKIFCVLSMLVGFSNIIASRVVIINNTTSKTMYCKTTIGGLWYALVSGQKQSQTLKPGGVYWLYCGVNSNCKNKIGSCNMYIYNTYKSGAGPATNFCKDGRKYALEGVKGAENDFKITETDCGEKSKSDQGTGPKYN